MSVKKKRSGYAAKVRVMSLGASPSPASGVSLPSEMSSMVSGFTADDWALVLLLCPNDVLLAEKRVWNKIYNYKQQIKADVYHNTVTESILKLPDIYSVVFQPSTFDLLAASRGSLLYGMTYPAFKVLVLCYIVTAREGGDKFLSVVDVAKAGLIPVQTCRDQFKVLEKAGLVGRAKHLDVHACRGNLAKRQIHYFFITSKGKETIRDFYKAYVQKLRDFQELFGKLESSFKFK